MIETATVTRPSFAELFAAHYHALVRLAGLLGADDPEDIAQEAFSRLHTRRLRDGRPGPPALDRLQSDP